jgi:hypothetical protein
MFRISDEDVDVEEVEVFVEALDLEAVAGESLWYAFNSSLIN